VIGAGPRAICGVLEINGLSPSLTRVETVLSGDFSVEGFDVLLVSGMKNDLVAIRNLVNLWRKRNIGPVLIGGPISSEPYKVLRRTMGDIAILGEGEATLEELLVAGLVKGQLPTEDSLLGIKGISFRGSDNIKFNSLRKVMPREEFNRFKPSTRVISNYELHYAARVYIETVRGCSNYGRATIGQVGELCNYCGECTKGSLADRYYCPIGIPPGCGYCSVPSLFGPPKTRKKTEIVSEITQLLARGVSRFVLSAPCFLDYGRDYLVDPGPLTDPRHPEPNYNEIDDLLSSLFSLEKLRQGKASVLIENIKAPLITDKTAEILGKYLSGTNVSIGLETGSQEHSRMLGRHSTPREVNEAIRRLSKAGIKPYVYIVYGLPGQNNETVEMTVNAIRKSFLNGAERIILYRFQALPMSCFANEPSAASYRKDQGSRQIYEAAKKANREAKNRLLNKKMKVIISEKYLRDKRYNVAYPMYHGPVVLVKTEDKLIGRITDVKIVGTLSDRIVEGVLTR
jgi:radical SAM superfamily enzyme YgiQ (UPF0313 family)